MRKALALLGVLALSIAMSVDAALAVESDATKTVTIRGTDVQLEYPASWKATRRPPTKVADLRAYLKQYPDEAAAMGVDSESSDDELREVVDGYLRSVALVRTNTIDGDNVVVGIWPPADQWWSGLDEWKKFAAASARATNADVVSDQRTKVGGREAFTHFERSRDGAYGYMEALRPGGKVLTVAVTVDDEDIEIAKSIIESVRER